MALKDGLVRAYVPWLGASGGRLIDRSNARNHGTLTNMDPGTDWTASTARGLPGTVLDFDGVNDSVNATATQSLTTYPFTLSSWGLVKAIPSASAPLISIGTGSSTYFAIGWANVSGTLRPTIIGRNTTFTQNFSGTGTNFPLNTWHHIVGVFESATSRKLYLNNRFIVTGTTSVTELANGTGVRIGSGFATLFFNGQIADALIWNRVLSDAEIAQLYQLGPGGLFRPQPRRLGFVPVTGGQTINANLFTNTNTFYNATVTAGAVNISANLLTNTSTFYDATVSSGATPQTITANLLTNANSFPNATVTPGAVTVSANLLSNTNTFYNATVGTGAASQNITANLLSNSNTFYNATVTPGTATISANRLESSNSFPSATVSSTRAITANLVPSTAQVFNATVSRSNNIQTDLVLSTNQFYSASVTSAAQITANRLNNSQSFPGATISTSGFPQTVSANLLSNTNFIFDATVAQEARAGSGLLLLGVG